MLISLPVSPTARRLAVGGGASALCVLLTGMIVQAKDPAIRAAAPISKSAKTGARVAPITLSAAQVAPPAALPGTAPLGMPALPALPPPQGPPLIELYFKDVPIVELLDMIARQGDVGIVIAEDVDVTRTLPRISLKEKTPAEALKIVASIAGLVLRKEDDRTYLIAKNAANLPPQEQPETAAVAKPEIPDLTTTVAPSLSLPLPDLIETERDDQPKENARDTHYIRIRNVSPRIIAWWIDPMHNPEPMEFRYSRMNVDKLLNPWMAKPALNPSEWNQMTGNGSASSLPSRNVYNPYAPSGSLNRDSDAMNSSAERFATPYTESRPQFGQGGIGGQGGQTGGRGTRGGATGTGGGAFELPEGVDQIIAVDPQNALLVYATEEGLRKLERIISLLDMPLKQVEIEAQFVTVTQSDSRSFGIDWSGASNGPFTANVTGIAPAPAPGSFSLGFVRNNFQATLRALASQNRSKTVSSPRVTAINNLTAGLFTSVSQPILLQSSTTGIGGQVGETDNLLFITTSVGLIVTPTINNDGTITVVMQPQVQNPNLVNIGGQLIPAPVTQTVNTIANVRDGETIALGGLRTKRSSRGGARIPVLSNIPFIGQFFRENRKSDSDEDLIIFLTARILHRAQDLDTVPGT